MDLEIRKMREDIIKVLNSHNLPIEVKRLAVKEVYQELAVKADEYIKIQIEKGVDDAKQISE